MLDVSTGEFLVEQIQWKGFETLEEIYRNKDY
jgi:hypothetical protein